MPWPEKKVQVQNQIEGAEGGWLFLFIPPIYSVDGVGAWSSAYSISSLFIPPIYSVDGGDVGAWSSARQFSADGHLLRGLPGEIRRKWENRGRENIVKEILIIISV